MVSGGQVISRWRDPGRDGAITEIVVANGDLVYSAALRCLNGNQEEAKELAQSVFVDFSRKWAQLPADTIVPGWLYQHTRFLAARFIRGELRRRRREQEAMRRHEMDSGGTELWKMIRPILDDALAALTEGERNAVVLRFLRGMSFRETGGELGISEDAARMRVGRALGRLRGVLKSFGIDSTSSALSASLMLASLGGAPVGFAKATALTALAAGGLPAGAWLVSIMNMTKTKMFVTGAALLVGVAVPVYLRVSLNRAEARHLTAMAEMGDALSSLQAEHDDLVVAEQKLRARLEQQKADRSELF